MKQNLLAILIFVLTIIAGCIYSVYNTDPHHWGFILGTALDYIHGKKLFSEIYIQYGSAEPILFRFLSTFMPINFTSIGFVGAAAYASMLLTLYCGMKKIANAFLAIIIMTLLFLLHSYSMYPWPDYFAGLCLALACLFLLGEQKPAETKRAVISGLFLFIAFLFRSTYLLNFGSAALVYFAFTLIDPRIRERKVLTALSVFGFLVAGYMLSLQLRGNLHLWYVQAFGGASSQYGVGFKSLINLLKECFFPSSTQNIFFSIFFYNGLYVVLTQLFKKKQQPGILVFFSLLGMAGIIQTALMYEMFRLQNACLPLYLVGAAKLFEHFPTAKDFWNNKKIPFMACWFFIFFFMRFPHTTSWYRFFDGRMKYSESKVALFQWHRFRDEENAYYEGLQKLLCDGKSPIMNFTGDSVLGYICPGQVNSSGTSFHADAFIKVINPAELEREQKGEFMPGELIIIDADKTIPPNPGVKLVEIGRVDRPDRLHYMRPVPVRVCRAEALK